MLDSGYSGWIRNANTISFNKFSSLLSKISEKCGKEPLNTSQTIKLYNNKIYIPEHKDTNSIFFFVREPGLSQGNRTEEEYIRYLGFMEGSADKITLENYCYEGILILDGSFTVPIEYNEKIEIRLSDKIIKTIDKL